MKQKITLDEMLEFQIEALYTGRPQVLVPAPGAGKCILIHNDNIDNFSYEIIECDADEVPK